jgi:gamma-glutamylcyclotransferase (GGCT)/AIG2-like uncharacterized protein YtfP
MNGRQVFVYGTLLRGSSNHFRMEGAEFVTAGTVRGRLYGIDWYPGLVLDDAGDEITGEVYQLPTGLLENLDAFEGPQYRRVLADVRCRSGHHTPLAAWVWEWLGAVDESRRIIGGDWISQH